MKFYTQFYSYTCGIELHARSLYVSIVDDQGKVVVHKQIKATPQALLRLITPECLCAIVVGATSGTIKISVAPANPNAAHNSINVELHGKPTQQLR